jgi:hypothetical protein
MKSATRKRYGVVLKLQDDTAPQVRPSGLDQGFYAGANAEPRAQISFSVDGGASHQRRPLDPARDDGKS